MTDNVMRREEVEIVRTLEEFEIKVEPEEPDEHVITAEMMIERQIEAAKEAAWEHWMQTCTGVWLPLPDLGSWPERYRRAFEEELARLKAARAR